ncbi:MAG: MltA domain-containing protein [Proteobacteria bacterium]|nr:MltA domain-containing protein [Pseudomonadota bacterium]MBU1647864.1 MltA domain-containing protein [Pseudomonadota bacterium]
MVILFLCLWSWPLPGHAAQQSPLLVPQQNQIPPLGDDMDRKSLITAATRHLCYLKTLPSNTVIHLGKEVYSKDWLLESMETFLAILMQKPSPAEFDHAIRENFMLYQASGRNNGRKKEAKGAMLITGYYEPLLEGSLTRNNPFIHPLYTTPDSLLSYRDPVTRKKTSGQQNTEGEKVPFWTRAEIEDGKLLAGGELVYLKDPVDAFVLHVQGSGKIRLRDGSLRAVQFASTNGREYKSIGKLLVDEKKMTREEATMPSIRRYLEQNPDDQRRILHHNPRFVFFQWNKKKESPTGSLGQPLTPGRSIAVDPGTLPTGVMAYLVSQKPVLDQEGQLLKWEPMQRFVLPQDTGAAIKGAGRADLFWGNGHYAETAAGNMKEQGQLYFLVKKNAKKNSKLEAELANLP